MNLKDLTLPFTNSTQFLKRNHLLDDDVYLPGGIKVSKKDFVDLIEKVEAVNIDETSGFHLSYKHLEVNNTGQFLSDHDFFDHFNKKIITYCSYLCICTIWI